MKTADALKRLALFAAAGGTVLDPLVGMAAQPAAQAIGAAAQPEIAANRPEVLDVALSTGGTLHGQVLDAAGQPLGGAPIAVLNGDSQVATAVSAADGGFVVPNLKGGVYRVTAGAHQGLYRLWSQGTAPPAARPQLLAASSGVVRGQRPLGDLIFHPLFIGTIVVAAVAIPVGVRQIDIARNRRNSSS